MQIRAWRRLYLNAKINSSTCRAAADRRHAKIGKKCEETARADLRNFAFGAVTGASLLPPSAILHPRKNTPRNYCGRNARGPSCIICVAPQIADGVSRSSGRRIFLPVCRECATLGPQTSSGVNGISIN